MKISIGAQVTDGPTGGGNQFVQALALIVTGKGREVIDRLDNSDIDVILMMETRRWLRVLTFGPLEILHYLRDANPYALVVHIINECDERKGAKTVKSQPELAIPIEACLRVRKCRK
jgi:hypothetical protein